MDYIKKLIKRENIIGWSYFDRRMRISNSIWWTS